MCRSSLLFLFVLSLSVLLPDGTARAASFDCDRASTLAEHLICSDPTLSEMDDEVSALYSAILERDDASVDRLRAEQRNWLRQFRDRCADRSCLSDRYRERLAALLSVDRRYRHGHGIARNDDTDREDAGPGARSPAQPRTLATPSSVSPALPVSKPPRGQSIPGIFLSAGAMLLVAAFGRMYFADRNGAARTRTGGRADRPGRPDGFDPRFVLSLRGTFTASELKARYRELTKQYHPDRLQGMGPEIIEVANRRLREINRAYEQLQRQTR